MAGKKGRKSNEELKECILCHKQFQPKVWNSTVCEENHYRVCEYCGEKYELKKDEKVKSLLERKSCYKEECVKKWKLESKKKRIYKKKCIICGEEFETYLYNINICLKNHRRICSICGEDFILRQEAHINRMLERDFCYKKECIKKHKGNLIKDNKSCQRTSINNQIFKKKCIICREEFETTSPKRLYCYREHKKVCRYCNKEFIIKTNYKTGHQIKIERQLSRDYCYDKECIQKGILESIKETSLERYGTEFAMQTDEFKERSKKTRIEKYGTYINPKTRKFEIVSQQNKEFSDLLNLSKIENEFEFSLDSRAYDIHVLNTNILIEINPSYTHNSTIGPVFKDNCRGRGKEKDYHLQKTLLANENNYRCIHIWDWDDWNKVISLIDINKQRLRGRQVQLKEISKQEADEFLDRFHIQGKCKGNEINLGLFYQDELIEVTTFGKPRYNKNYEWEWLRLASNNKYQIMGGVGKFWKYFQETYRPKSIITYIDNSKFSTDNFLNNFNFKLLDYGHPTCHWYRRKGRLHYTDNLLRQRGADKLLGTNYGKPEICGLNNKQVMIKEGFVEVYDCGQSTWTWIKE